MAVSRPAGCGFLGRLAIVAWGLVCFPAAGADAVGPVSQELRRAAGLDPFYQKCVMAGPLPVIGSAKVTDHALLEAAYLIRHMLAGRDDILRAMADRGARVAIMAHDEYTTDLPEHRHLRPRVYRDSRSRGLGGRLCSAAEENLLGFPGDPYAGEIILIHELAHSVHLIGMAALDPGFDARLEAAYQDAVRRGLWKGTYAGTESTEYWAECTQVWFDDNRHDDALHNHVRTRAMLKEYDPGAAKLCAEVYGDKEWRYRKPAERPAAERAHLAGYDPAKAPRFRWREVPVPEKPHVVIETGLGDIVLELDAKAAPLTVRNFLGYVQERMYHNGRFFRTVTAANQPDDKVKIAVVQIEADPSRQAELRPPIPLERTRDTGLRHVDGALSMARAEPDSAQDSFSICVGDQPELDFGGGRNPDGQGFAVFGRVTEGMDIVRKIHAMPAEGQQLKPPVPIQRVIRLD